METLVSIKPIRIRMRSGAGGLGNGVVGGAGCVPMDWSRRLPLPRTYLSFFIQFIPSQSQMQGHALYLTYTLRPFLTVMQFGFKFPT